jgi:hypothetical protein
MISNSMQGITVKDFAPHLPYALGLFLVLFFAFIDLSMRTESAVIATLLAPMLWLGLYWLGSNPTKGRG